MKNIQIQILSLIAALLVLCCMSCGEDFIDLPAKGRLSTDAFVPYQAVNGCYAAFYRNDIVGGQYDTWATELLGNVASDDAWKGGENPSDAADVEEVELFQAKSNNYELENFWRNYYCYIYFFNTALSGLESYEDISDEKRTQYISEVRFLRAYVYMRLVIAFGSRTGNMGVVLVDHAPLLQEEIGKIPRSTYSESWDFIIEDLKFAEENLPLKSQYGVSDLGRATQGAAQALLTRAYMYIGDWANCEAYAKKVIDSQEYQLETQFSDVYSKEKENGDESIFEIAYALDGYTGWEWSHCSYWAIAQQPREPWYGWGLGGLTTDLLNEFMQDPGDPRIVWTFLFQGDEDISSGDAAVMDFTGYLCPDLMHLRKIWDPLYLTSPDGNTDFNLHVIRYADLLLMYAEAANENGKLNEALDALNQVRKRARESSFDDPYRVINGYSFPINMPTEERVPDVNTSSKDELREAIWHERRVELAGEGYRFYDIVRQGRAGELMRAFASNYNTSKGANYTDGVHECFPIPSIDISASNGTLEQNPGYN